MNEAETRAEQIDPALKAAGWGVVEGSLDQNKLTPLLRPKYRNSINDAVADPGDDIGQAFAGFQKYLYQDVA